MKTNVATRESQAKIDAAAPSVPRLKQSALQMGTPLPHRLGYRHCQQIRLVRIHEAFGLNVNELAFVV